MNRQGTVAADGNWVGQPLKRREDPELLTGRGRFIADLVRPGMLHAAFLRSPHPHARIRSIDPSRALALPGVHAILTGQDLPADLGPQPVTHIFTDRKTPNYALARDRVRYVGEPVAVVAAVSPYVAEDAVEQIDVEWELLPAVGDVEASLRSDAPRLYDDWPDNVAGVFQAQMGDVDRALAEADIVLTERFRIQRQFACPLETRGVLAEWDTHRGELTLWSSTQILHIARDCLADVLGIPEHRIRVLVPRIGGGFGCKFHFYAEEVAVALLARKAGRPVRWIEDRLESFVATVHAREQIIEATMAARRDGTITAVTAEIVGDIGAHMHTVSYGPVWLTSVMITNVYLIPNARVHTRAVVTNKTPLGSYRGWGQPQANFVVERLVDRLAKRLGMDPAEVRRKNFVPPDRFPYKSLHHTFDSGRYAACLDRALQLIGYQRWRQRQADLRRQGRYVGLGLSFYVENTALGPSRMLNAGGVLQGGYDIARVRIEPSGDVTVYTGLCEMGQGFTNGIAQLCAQTLGVDPDQVTVVTGDTQSCPYTGYGTGASRSASVGGAAVMMASQRLREKVEAIAAHMLEASVDDLVMASGRIWIRGAPTRAVSMADIGRAAYLRAIELPPDMAPGLEAIEVFDPPQMAWPYGVNAAVVEVDIETGRVVFHDYAVMHDSGTLLNPMIVEGQLHGGVAQGIGAALFEDLKYDEVGQPLTRTFMDYLIPTAAEIPRFRIDHDVTPSPIIPGGMKGVGEAGIIGPPAAVVNAVEDALEPFGVKFTETPLSPERVLEAIDRARGRPT
ncbi:MAG: xanthine dehydrogenase family protein molybdopterin-binding subunit [Armatimonadota bacterium]|nr:xanthine dehydrogenase family protein molybdopterin-binding subunit [Armatimonadota bacterium]